MDRDAGMEGSSHPCRPLRLGVFLFHCPREQPNVAPAEQPNVAPAEPLLKTCWSSRAEPVWEIGPLAAATLLLIAIAGFRPTAAAATPAVFRMQRIGCQSGTFLLAARASRIGLDRQCPGHRGLVAGASYDDRSYVLSPGDGEVIWKGSGGGESASV